MAMKAEKPDYQKQFEAAVRVIQGLPKNGSYHPSYEEMLCFYSYYKQAIVGQCQTPRPGFWDPIGRYKWDAWNGLGKMTKGEAMAAYIEEMKKAAQKVINTVPMDESLEDMFVYFEPLYEVIHDMPRPPESFFKKKAEPIHKAVENSQMASDSESEVFCDSLEQVDPDQARRASTKRSLPLDNPHRLQVGEQNPQPSPDERGLSSSPEVLSESLAGALIQQEVNLQLMSTVQALQQDMKKVIERLSYLESWAALQDHATMLNLCPLTTWHDEKEPQSWPVRLSSRTWFFLLAWPFVAQLLFWYFQRQKR
ncbi:acyl-CoA-binding domain-containing protein 4 [Elgaria multicarinata webbii]|uniref:acyl-CoA-binding domain-containing protein 4 n=1 Tax=Elgaria multicarinata webbii TaxID=159646 RepID=UPI002FCD4F72